MFYPVKRRLTRRLPLHLTFTVLALLFPARAVVADPIGIWNFNDSDLIVDHGAGTLTSNFNVANLSFAAGTSNNARLGDGAGQALSLQGGTSAANNGRNLTVALSTVGFANIIFSFATQGTSTGFNSNQFQYSLDGVTFSDFGSPYTPLVAFGAVPIVFDLSGITGLNNNPDAKGEAERVSTLTTRIFRDRMAVSTSVRAGRSKTSRSTSRYVSRMIGNDP